MRSLVVFGALLLSVSAQAAEAPPADAPTKPVASDVVPRSDDAVAAAQTAKAWRIPRVVVLPVVAGAVSVGSFFGAFFAFSGACGGSIGIGGDYLGACGFAMIGTIFSAYIMLVPAAVSAVGLLMKGRGQFGISVLGALAGVTLSAVGAFFGFPFFAVPMLLSVVMAPAGAVIAYELSSLMQENNVLDRVQPMVMPLRDGVAAGVRIALW